MFGTKKKKYWSTIFKAKPNQTEEPIETPAPNEVYDHKQFCPGCGSKLEEGDQKYCMHCGTEI